MKNSTGRENACRSSNTCSYSKRIEQKAIASKSRVNCGFKAAYNAAIAILLHFLSFRGEVNSFEDPDSPDSAIRINALALKRSIAMYSRFVKKGYRDESGNKVNRGSSNGAWWKTPPS